MEVRILDLDGSLPLQQRLRKFQPRLWDARAWGKKVRLACSFRRFRAWQLFLTEAFGCAIDTEPQLTLYGSGDFHHLSLALLQRLPGPCNLLILDNHPDWVQGLPLLHCGSWVAHALRLKHVRRVFHVGGEQDFDNGYRWLAPWRELRSGRVVVFPALRRFYRGAWGAIDHQPLRASANQVLTPKRLEELLQPYSRELGSVPLYISVDKDVLRPADAVVNWDSGHLRLAEVDMILDGFLQAAGREVAGIDLLGDWSPVQVEGWLRGFLHQVEHEALAVDPALAARRNEATNVVLIAGCLHGDHRTTAIGRKQSNRHRELLPSR